MKTSSRIALGAAVLIMTLGVCAFVSWRAARRERAELQERLRTAEHTLQEASARQESRKAELEQQLAELQRQKKAVRTSSQVVKALPGVLPLPRPIVLGSGWATPQQTHDNDRPDGQSVGTAGIKASATDATESREGRTETEVRLPEQDLKPLYDFAVECKACQAELVAAHQDLKDERTKTQALRRERDDALQALHAARGGSVLRRVARAAKWFVIGAAAGAVAAKLAH